MNRVASAGAALLASLLILASPGMLRADPEKPPAEEKSVAKTPEEAWSQFQKAIGGKDKDRIWSLLSKDSRESLEKEIGGKLKSAEGTERAEMAKELGVTEEAFAKMSEKELVLAMILQAASASENDLVKLKVKDIKVDGDKAEGNRDVSADEKTEETTKAYFLKEDGEWKIDIKREMEEARKDSEKEEPPPPDDK
jgi:hypothetical protein